MTTLLIDGDVIAYRAAFATEKSAYLVTEHCKVLATADNAVDAKNLMERHEAAILWSRKEVEPAEKAIMIAHVMISDIRAHFDGAPARIFLSGVGNFRNQIATRASYKGNRAEKPKNLKPVIADLVKSGAEVSTYEEADDLIGIAMTATPGAVCCSIDKDLKQLPGRHYNFVDKEESLVSPREAALSFFAQVLSGDATDNIPGISGIGPVKARKLLAECKSPGDCWQRILDVYRDAYKERGDEFALEAARLVYVRRKAGEIWDPSYVQASKTEAQQNTKGRGSRGVSKRVGKVDSGRSEVQGSAV